jgi:hypothetical protein
MPFQGHRFACTLHFLFGLALVLAAPLSAQVTPAPGWCSMGHCNPQMSDFSAQTPPGVNGSVYVRNSDTANSGVAPGDGCVSNGTYVACAYKQSWNALVVYDGDGNTVWSSGSLLDNHNFAGMPIMQADGSMVAGDDQHLYGFTPDGSVAWSTVTPGGVPIGLVPTPNGAIFVGTASQQLQQCWQGNCTLVFNVNNGGAGYTSATVTLAGGDCPGAAATATVSAGAVTAVTVASQGSACYEAPDVMVTGNGSAASVSAALAAAAPITVYNSATGAVAGSTYLYQNGSGGPYYGTINTACVNNGSYPNRIYVVTALTNDNTQGALWALDIDPNNLISPISPAWSLVIHGPSGASPLCVGNTIYMDGAGVVPGDNVGTTIFGIEDNGTSGSFLFQQSLGAGSQPVTCNFALDPRTEGGFWHQLKYDANIYHRDFNTGNLIETINVSNLLTAAGAPPSSYWQAGVFTTYGSASHPYLMLPEAARPANLGYLAMLDISVQQLVWAVPLAGNDDDPNDTPGGDAALVMDSNGNPVIVMNAKQTGAYFIANGGPAATVSLPSLSFGSQLTGSTSGVQSVALTNSASAVVTIGNIAASGPFAETNTCGATLAPGTSCTISVTFSPTAAGAQSGYIAVIGNSPNSPQTVLLTGIGVISAPVASLSANQVNFLTQASGTVSPPRPITLSNTGAAALAIAGITPSGAAAETNNCPTELAAGASCMINVMLAAPSIGACTGTVIVNTNAPGGAQSISVSGLCVPLPPIEAALSTTSLVFLPQTVGTVSTSQAVTVLNIGILPLNIVSIAPTGDVTETNNCPSTLSVGASCIITTCFTPSATGSRSGSVTVTDTAPDSPQVVSISGVGLANPTPVVNQPLLPAAVQPGTGGLTLTVTGTGFVAGSVVYWNGTPRATTYIDNLQISASLTAADVAAPGTGSVSVVNASPGGGQSNVVWLPVAYPSPAPLLTNYTIPASAGPSSLTAADWNADGKLDLAVTNAGAGTVSILLGNGDGTFAAKVDYATGNQPMAIAAGDFNHDGILDLAVVNQADNTVSILLGTGGGAFALQRVYATGNQPDAVTVADLNGDGNLDLAVANMADNTVSILFGNGDGTFAGHLDYPAGENPSAVIAGDFNGDGMLDLAVANDFTPGGTVTILLNHGDGSYLHGVAYATGDSVSLVAADFNGDGKLDFAAVTNLAQTLSVYSGNGNGTFTLGPSQTTHLSPFSLGLAAADVNGDGTLELLVTSNSTNSVTAFENNDAATFSTISQYGAVAGLTALTAGDFNNDGSIDLAAVVAGSNTIAILLQSPAAALSSASLNFGTVQTGSSATQAVTVTNSGSALLNIGAIGTSGSYSETDNCGVSIAPGSSCTVTVAFNPTAPGTQTGVLTIPSNAPAGPQTVNLSGAGATFTVLVGLPLNTVIGGASLPSNTVTLAKPAPAGGWTVTLSSSNPSVASVPASVTVAAGATVSSSFTIGTAAVAVSTPITITASLNAWVGTGNLTVNSVGAAFALTATTVTGGLPLTSNTLTLANPAPAGGLVFNLTSSNPALASVPASVTVAAGATVSSAFTVNTVAVGSDTTVAIFASQNGVTAFIANASLELLAAAPGAVVLSPPSVTAGRSTTANVVYLATAAPSSGTVVTLSSSRPNVAGVQASVTVAGNNSVSQPFTISTGYVAASTPVTITATFSGVSVSATLTVTPDGAASVNLSPASVVGGTAPSAANTVTLLSPAPPAGANVKLSSGNPAVAAVPSTVKVSAGSNTSAAFKIATTAVSASTPVIITATYGGVAVSSTLTVSPLAPSTVNLSQPGVLGGKTLSGNTVTLNAPAPSGGVTISLASSRPGLVGVPATVTVAAGSLTSQRFSITTSSVTTQTSVTILAVYKGNSATATLTLKP